jgi:hypothetical protein
MSAAFTLPRELLANIDDIADSNGRSAWESAALIPARSGASLDGLVRTQVIDR